MFILQPFDKHLIIQWSFKHRRFDYAFLNKLLMQLWLLSGLWPQVVILHFDNTHMRKYYHNFLRSFFA